MLVCCFIVYKCDSQPIIASTPVLMNSNRQIYNHQQPTMLHCLNWQFLFNGIFVSMIIYLKCGEYRLRRNLCITPAECYFITCTLLLLIKF